jgi:hypothetical protein
MVDRNGMIYPLTTPGQNLGGKSAQTAINVRNKKYQEL